MHRNWKKGLLLVAVAGILGQTGIRAEAAELPAQSGSITIEGTGASWKEAGYRREEFSYYNRRNRYN